LLSIIRAARPTLSSLGAQTSIDLRAFFATGEVVSDIGEDGDDVIACNGVVLL